MRHDGAVSRPGDAVDDVVYLTRIATPLGAVLLGATGAGVCLLEFLDDDAPAPTPGDLARRLGREIRDGANEHTARLARELDEYFAGTRRHFDTPLAPNGTEFQKTVWNALREIPYGETRSYAEQARRLGAPAAIRAVAAANGQNPIAIVIPCHRVIGTDGKLTGYAGGLWRKEWLLRHEGATGGWRAERDAAQMELGLELEPLR